LEIVSGVGVDEVYHPGANAGRGSHGLAGVMKGSAAAVIASERRKECPRLISVKD
jgi:hypothetical protein